MCEDVSGVHFRRRSGRSVLKPRQIRINLGVFVVRNPALNSREFGIEEFEGSPCVWLPFVSRLLPGLENGPASVEPFAYI
jgi:hypothetical protein